MENMKDYDQGFRNREMAVLEDDGKMTLEDHKKVLEINMERYKDDAAAKKAAYISGYMDGVENGFEERQMPDWIAEWVAALPADKSADFWGWLEVIVTDEIAVKLNDQVNAKKKSAGA